MSNKNDILNNLKKSITQKYDMPDIDIQGIAYSNPVAQFITVSETVGGTAVLLPEGENINVFIKSIYPYAEKIVSNLPDISIANINPDDTEPILLNNTDLAVIKGELGVAENGCVWIPQNVKEKVTYFIATNLVILLNKNSIVNNMHEAYSNITFNNYGFGVFISGPSKTADIEQALVIGAHGAKGVTVILI